MLITRIILSIRHLFYNKGWLESSPTEVTSVCVGNLAVGGTGKTPMTELIIRTLLEDSSDQAEKVVREEDIQFNGLFTGIDLYDGNDFGGKEEKDRCVRNVAVLSRGYKRKTSGFQQVVVEGGSAAIFGDEPLQVKKKFPDVTVAVDEDRVEGARLLTHPEEVASLPEKLRSKILFPSFPKAGYIILDDAYQHRRIIATKSILLTTYDKPYFKDRLIPLGRLRDLRSRARAADMIIVTKCPTVMNEWEKAEFAQKAGLKLYDLKTCKGTNADGKSQFMLFATMLYDKLLPVFPEGDARYTHSKTAVLFTGIANDTPLQQHLCESFRIADHYVFPDHHRFSRSDMEKVTSSARRYSTAIVITTEKDAQRLYDFAADNPASFSPEMRRRCFYAPIRTMMLTPGEQSVLKEFLLG